MNYARLVFSCCLEACEHVDVPVQLDTSPCFTSDEESDGSEGGFRHGDGISPQILKPAGSYRFPGYLFLQMM